MYMRMALASLAIIALSACVAAREDIDPSSGQYEPEGFDPERELEPSEPHPSEPSP
ncbi:hypothetical protein [Parasphingorhabdus sp.]